MFRFNARCSCDTGGVGVWRRGGSIGVTVGPLLVREKGVKTKKNNS